MFVHITVKDLLLFNILRVTTTYYILTFTNNKKYYLMHFYVFKMAASIAFVCQNAVEAICFFLLYLMIFEFQNKGPIL